MLSGIIGKAISMNLRHLSSLVPFVAPEDDFVEAPDMVTVWGGVDPDVLVDILEALNLEPSLSFLGWDSLPDSIREELELVKAQYDFVRDAVTLTKTSTDEEQLEAYAALLGYLQPIYYPMYSGELDDLVHDFWIFLNTPESYSELVKNLRDVPGSIKTFAINWLMNQNRSKYHNHELDARLREEVNRAAGHIDLSDYLDEAYNRIFSFTEKQLVSFIRKFKELKKVEKGEHYALSPDQIDLFDPLFEKAQYLLKEIRTADSSSRSYKFSFPVLDSASGVVELTEPLADLLGTLFDIDEVSGDVQVVDVQDSISELVRRQDSVSNINFLSNFYTNRIACLSFSARQK